MISKLKCRVCDKYKSKISEWKNFNDKWIVEAESLKTNNIRDHASTEQHQEAMLLEKMEQAQEKGAPFTGPILRAITTLGEDERIQLRAKFDIAYLVATEKIAFTKYPKICDLEIKLGFQLGNSYLHMESGKTFVHYVTESKREELVAKTMKEKFYSVLLDGSADSANVDNELLLGIWFDLESSDKKVHTRMSLLIVDCPDSVTTKGLFDSQLSGLQRLGIQSISETDCFKLVGIGTGGVSTNIAVKGMVEERVFCMRCLALPLMILMR